VEVRTMGGFQEWDSLCSKYESAQDAYTAAYLAITARLFTGGADGRGPIPTAAEVARWDATRARLRDLDERMRAYVSRLRQPASGESSSGLTGCDSELH
jgi:hypothetical protein